jgi:hypothetical protein
MYQREGPWYVVPVDSVRLSTVACVYSTAVLIAYERKPKNAYRWNFSEKGGKIRDSDTGKGGAGFIKT